MFSCWFENNAFLSFNSKKKKKNYAPQGSKSHRHQNNGNQLFKFQNEIFITINTNVAILTIKSSKVILRKEKSVVSDVECEPVC